VYTRTNGEDRPHEARFTNQATELFAVLLTEPPQKVLTLRVRSIIRGGYTIFP
jgi:hypothetical protein